MHDMGKIFVKSTGAGDEESIRAATNTTLEARYGHVERRYKPPQRF